MQAARRRPAWYCATLPAMLIAAACMAASPAGAAPRNSRSSAAQPLSPVAPAPAQSAIVPPGTTSAGLCQCISERTERRTACLASPAVCQSTCGSSNYSFVPDAVFSCSAAAQAAGPQ